MAQTAATAEGAMIVERIAIEPRPVDAAPPPAAVVPVDAGDRTTVAESVTKAAAARGHGADTGVAEMAAEMGPEMAAGDAMMAVALREDALREDVLREDVREVGARQSTVVAPRSRGDLLATRTKLSISPGRRALC